MCCVWVLPACMLVHHVCAMPKSAEEGVDSPGTGVADVVNYHVVVR